MTNIPLKDLLNTLGGVGQHGLERNAWGEVAVLMEGGNTMRDKRGDEDAIVRVLAARVQCNVGQEGRDAVGQGEEDGASTRVGMSGGNMRECGGRVEGGWR